MSDFLAQAILAARNRGIEDWTNILLIVVVALFWAIGGILKARASKTKPEDEEQLTRKPVRKPPEGTRELQKRAFQQRRPAGPVPPKRYRPEVQQARRKIVRPQPAAQKFAPKKEEGVQLQTIEMPEVSKPPLPRPQLQPEPGELPEFTTKTIKNLEDKRIGIPAERPRAEYLPKLLLAYDDPDGLKKAILHYEILGRPLSLREPSAFRVLG